MPSALGDDAMRAVAEDDGDAGAGQHAHLVAGTDAALHASQGEAPQQVVALGLQPGESTAGCTSTQAMTLYPGPGDPGAAFSHCRSSPRPGGRSTPCRPPGDHDAATAARRKQPPWRLDAAAALPPLSVQRTPSPCHCGNPRTPLSHTTERGPLGSSYPVVESLAKCFALCKQNLTKFRRDSGQSRGRSEGLRQRQADVLVAEEETGHGEWGTHGEHHPGPRSTAAAPTDEPDDRRHQGQRTPECRQLHLVRGCSLRSDRRHPRPAPPASPTPPARPLGIEAGVVVLVLAGGVVVGTVGRRGERGRSEAGQDDETLRRAVARIAGGEGELRCGAGVEDRGVRGEHDV